MEACDLGLLDAHLCTHQELESRTGCAKTGVTWYPAHRSALLTRGGGSKPLNPNTYTSSTTTTMTYVNGDILTVKRFSKVPALGPNIAAVDRPPHSAGGSSATTSQTHHSVVKRDEPCFVTNSILYTHELVHFVRDIQGDDDRKEKIVRALHSLNLPLSSRSTIRKT